MNDVDLDTIGTQDIEGFKITIIDPVSDYAELMQSIFDFNLLKQSISSGYITLLFDAMSAITGPYAKRIFIDMLGASPESVINAEPLEDFGGHHPLQNLLMPMNWLNACSVATHRHLAQHLMVTAIEI